jgi:hypothetical protein
MSKKKQIDPIPDEFASPDEAAEFWDTHDTTDYPRAFRTVRVVAELRNRHFVYGWPSIRRSKIFCAMWKFVWRNRSTALLRSNSPLSAAAARTPRVPVKGGCRRSASRRPRISSMMS